ncbi:MAG: hypothetical protein U0869_21540 [Chloroflexota bacterium]
MATFERLPRFDRDWAELDPGEQARFHDAARGFLDELAAGQPAPSSRLQGIRGAPGVFELSWSTDGHATLSSAAGPHIVWRRVGVRGRSSTR